MINKDLDFPFGEEIRIKDSTFDASGPAKFRRSFAWLFVFAVVAYLGHLAWDLFSSSHHSSFVVQIFLFILLIIIMGYILIRVSGVAGICLATVYSEWITPERLTIYRFLKKIDIEIKQCSLKTKKHGPFFFDAVVLNENGFKLSIYLLTRREVELLKKYVNPIS